VDIIKKVYVSDYMTFKLELVFYWYFLLFKIFIYILITLRLNIILMKWLIVCYYSFF